MKRVRMKYCGGCNPVHDRERYAAAIRLAAGTRIHWVLSDTEDVADILIINGCQRACMLEELGRRPAGCRIVSVQDGRAAPEEIVGRLLEE